MAKKFRNLRPKRTCTKQYKNYRDYKTFLRRDFNGRCGYTNCSDSWFGGVNTFHIDHFKPTSKNPDLETNYSNLVYCCSYVNILKSNDDGEYIDPCDVDYNEHFERDEEGNILPKQNSSPAKYMYKKLKLHLKKYQIIWKLDELSDRIEKLELILDKENDLLKSCYYELSKMFREYKDSLHKEQ